jgi:hypothetical protein
MYPNMNEFVIKSNKLLKLKASILFLSIFYCLIICSCSNSNQTEKQSISQIIKKWQGKELFLPQNKQISNNNISRNAPKLKIVSYIDGKCGVCVSDLKKWKTVIEDFKSYKNIDYVFYINTLDFDAFSKFINKDGSYPIPLVNDSDNVFFERNALEKIKLFQTFLLGEKNEVILIGNPLFSEKLKALYLQEIKKK